MKIVTAAEMREIDRRTSERFGVPSLILMENAGTAVAEFILERYPQAKTVGVICGKGNNGGDGFVAARRLHRGGRQVGVIVLADPAELKGDAAEMFARMPVGALPVRTDEELAGDNVRQVFGCDLLVDALLGTGFQPPVRGLYEKAIQVLWKRAEAGVPVVAVDIPSGRDADQMGGEETGHMAAPAHATVTFTAPRPAHVFAPELQGQPVVVAEIGSPAEAVESSLKLHVTTPQDIERFAAPRPPGAHKGNYGHVLLIGGSVGKAGAAAMAGMAALRSGAGLVTVATPKSVLPTVAGFAAELMTEPLEETEQGTISLRALEYGRMDAILQGKDVLAIGPGISRNVETAEAVRTLVRRAAVPVVLDADGLNAFEGAPEKLDGTSRTLILTPHPGEMARLAGISTGEVQKDRLGVARRFAQDHNCIVVLKGHLTVVAQPDGSAWINPTGNPGMATGGMGDILTGLIAGLAGQEAGARDDLPKGMAAAIAGVYLHGLAGDLGAVRLGEQSLTATDLLADLPDAFATVRGLADSGFAWVGLGLSVGGAARTC